MLKLTTKHLLKPFALLLLSSSIISSPMCLASPLWLIQNRGGDGKPLSSPSWLSADHDYANSNNQLLESQLSPSTVKHLTTKLINLPNGYNQLAPVVSSDNIAYFGDEDVGDVYAVNILTGKVIFNVPVSKAFVNGYPYYGTHAYDYLLPFYASPVISGNYLYIADYNGVLYQLNRFNGSIVNSVTIGQPLNGVYNIYGPAQGNYTPNGSLLYANNVPAYTAEANLGVVDRTNEGKPPLIVFGLTAGDSDEEGAANATQTWEHSGAMVGINSQTLRIEWLTPFSRFAGGDNIWNGGPAIDPSRHRLYIGVGNLHTPPINPSSPIAPDYSDSLVAINYDTGQIVDHVQFTKGDMSNDCYQIPEQVTVCNPTANVPFLSLVPTPINFNAFLSYIANPHYILNGPVGSYNQFVNDVASPPNLFTITVNGRSMDVVGVDDKFGTYAVFNRDNLSQMIWVTPSVGNSKWLSSPPVVDSPGYGQGVVTATGASIGGAALDYQNNLIWLATSGSPYPPYGSSEPTTAYSYVQAMDMNTGVVKASFAVPVPANDIGEMPSDLNYNYTGSSVFGSLVIANNVLYIVDNISGALTMYSIPTGCCSVHNQPQLIAQKFTPDGAGGIYAPTRNVAVVNGHIIESIYGTATYSGGLMIYGLKVPSRP